MGEGELMAKPLPIPEGFAEINMSNPGPQLPPPLGFSEMEPPRRFQFMPPGKPMSPSRMPPARKYAPDYVPAWSDIPGEALGNVGPSAANLAKSIVQPILHPIDTANAFYDIGKGLVSKTAGALGAQQDPAEKEKAEAAANAVGQFLKDRYGSVDAFKRTLATDPVGAIADISLVLTGGGAAMARAPGAIGQAGQAVRVAGSAIDPIANTVRAAKLATNATGRVAAPVLGTTTGAGQLPIETAYQAGRQGNITLPMQMRRGAPVSDVVDMAESAVEAMGRDRSAAYNRNMATTRANVTPLDVTPIAKAIDSAREKLTYNGFVKDAAAAKIHAEMAEKFNEFLKMPLAERTAEALDALKQSIGEIRDRTTQGKLARNTVNEVYNTIRAEIVKQSPDYARAMSDYSEATDKIGEVRRALSVNDKAATDTTLRKLQSTMRNNVATNYGQRTKMLEELAQHQPELPYALAGQALNSLMPRGLANATAPMTAMGGYFINPMLAIPGAMAGSPRLVGEAAYGAGRFARGAAEVAQAAPPELLARALMAGNTATAPANPDDELGLFGVIRPKRRLPNLWQ